MFNIKKILLFIVLSICLMPSLLTAEQIACEVLEPKQYISKSFGVKEGDLIFYNIDNNKKKIYLYKTLTDDSFLYNNIFSPDNLNPNLNFKKFKQPITVYFTDNEIIFMERTRQESLDYKKKYQKQIDELSVADPLVHFIFELDRLTGILLATGTLIDENGESLNFVVNEKMMCYGENYINHSKLFN